MVPKTWERSLSSHFQTPVARACCPRQTSDVFNPNHSTSPRAMHHVRRVNFARKTGKEARCFQEQGCRLFERRCARRPASRSPASRAPDASGCKYSRYRLNMLPPVDPPPSMPFRFWGMQVVRGVLTVVLSRPESCGQMRYHGCQRYRLKDQLNKVNGSPRLF